jgi:hypothetical protein
MILSVSVSGGQYLGIAAAMPYLKFDLAMRVTSFSDFSFY